MILTPPRDPLASIEDAFALFARCPEEAPFERALWGGAHADRLGYAFVAGYQAAIRHQFPDVPARASLAVTEAGGGHPKAMTTRLVDGRLTGEKTFATLASVAEAIFVLAHDGARLVVARIRSDAAGVSIALRAPTPFAPEIPHAKLTLADVVPEAILPGDGFSDYVRPFRTTEDVHVLAAACAYMIASFDRAIAEEALALVFALRSIAATPAAPEAHLALAGAFRTARRLAEATPNGDAETIARWERDRPLLAIAEIVRAKRTENAWAAVTTTK